MMRVIRGWDEHKMGWDLGFSRFVGSMFNYFRISKVSRGPRGRMRVSNYWTQTLTCEGKHCRGRRTMVINARQRRRRSIGRWTKTMIQEQKVGIKMQSERHYRLKKKNSRCKKKRRIVLLFREFLRNYFRAPSVLTRVIPRISFPPKGDKETQSKS